MIIPATRYPDCDAALVFLRDVLGLTEHQIFRDESGLIVHGQMGLGGGIFMFGRDTQPGDFADLMITPSETAGRATVTIYAVMPDVEACHDRALNANAEILMPLEAQGHGGTAFSCRDPGSHIWMIGDYDPQAV